MLRLTTEFFSAVPYFGYFHYYNEWHHFLDGNSDVDALLVSYEDLKTVRNTLSAISLERAPQLPVPRFLNKEETLLFVFLIAITNCLS